MKMKKFIAMMATVAMVAGLAVGCGGGSDAEGEGGASGEFDSSMDITIVSREDGSGTRGAFIELFGIEEEQEDGEKVDMTTEAAQITNSTSVMLTTVAGDEYAIGYVSLGSLDDSVKMCIRDRFQVGANCPAWKITPLKLLGNRGLLTRFMITVPTARTATIATVAIIAINFFIFI